MSAHAFASGKNSAFPAGTVHSRVSVVGANAPTRNQTGPDCPALQSAVLRMALLVAGCDKTHCHQFTDHWA